MKQEPVLWMSPDGKVSTTEGKLFYIPLYTAPRELSDEEKDEIIVEYMGEQHKGDYVLRHMIGAILKKASEK